ncbi:MAG: cobyrinic acid a,c-diamide synthase, partial [Methanobacterium sp.]
ELIPRIRIEARGNIPEVEMKLEEFCLHAMNTVLDNMDVQKIIDIAEKPVFSDYLSFEDILKSYS